MAEGKETEPKNGPLFSRQLPRSTRCLPHNVVGDVWELTPGFGNLVTALQLEVDTPLQSFVVHDLVQFVKDFDQVFLILHHLIDVFVRLRMLVEQRFRVVPIPGLALHPLL